MRKAVITLTAFLGCLFAILGLGASGAYAEGEALQGILRSENQPVAGVKISAFTQDGQPVGSVESGADGKWVIPVPAAGTYRVDLDVSTLPDDVGLTNNRPSLTLPVFAGSARNVLFPLAPGGGADGQQNKPSESTRWDRVPGLTYSGVHLGLIIALAALGLSLIFGTMGLTNFAHGEMVTFGAMMAFLFNVTLGHVPLVLAGAIAVLLGGVLGWLQDRFFWGMLRRRGTGLVAMMIVSIGLSLFIRYVFLYFFGGQSESFADFVAQPGIEIGPLSVAPKNLICDAIAIVVLIAVSSALIFTRLGKATRAVADNPALAAASGINVDRIIRLVWMIGGALAALAGVVLGVYQNVGYQMGFQILLLVFASVTLGGLGTAYGALLGSLVIGLFVQLSTLWIPTELQTVGALVVLILILLVRPQGILGRRERIG